MVSTNNLKSGMTLIVDDQLMEVVDFQHVKPGKGGAFVRTTLKTVEGGKVLKRTFRAGQDVAQAIVRTRELQYLYREGDAFVFMDTETYEQTRATPEILGDAMRWFTEGDMITVREHEGRILGVDLPASVALTITDTQPGLAGDTVTNATKDAILETGVTVQVPLFIDEGETVRVDPRTGEYQSRA